MWYIMLASKFASIDYEILLDTGTCTFIDLITFIQLNSAWEIHTMEWSCFCVSVRLLCNVTGLYANLWMVVHVSPMKKSQFLVKQHFNLWLWCHWWTLYLNEEVSESNKYKEYCMCDQLITVFKFDLLFWVNFVTFYMLYLYNIYFFIGLCVIHDRMLVS